MKASSAISERASDLPPPIGQSSARRPTPTSADSFSLAGPSDLPDPDFNAYRRDLADLSLAGRVIASHYAAPVERTVVVETVLRRGPSEDSEAMAELARGAPFAMLDDSVGWAWGYVGEEGRVGYVRSEALKAS